MKLAAVRLEAESFADPRFAHLERLLGFPPCRGQLGLIRVALIWSWQTEHYTPEAPCFHVPESVIEMALEVDGPTAIAALVRARLAVEEPEGVRMKGADHERTGWLWRTRQKGRAGAEAKHAKRKRGDSKNGSAPDNSVAGAHHGHTTGKAQGNPLSSLLSVPEESLSLGGRAGARDPGAPTPAPAPPVAAGTVPAIAPLAAGDPDLRELVDHARTRLDEARKAIDPDAESLPIFGGQPEADFVQRMRETPPADRRRLVDRAIGALAAEARAEGDVGKLRFGMLGGPRSWLRLTAAGRSRPPARASPPPARRPHTAAAEINHALEDLAEAQREAARGPG